MLLRCHFICTIDLAYFKKCSSLLCIIPVQIYMRRLQQIIDGKARSSKYQKEAKCYNVKRPALTKYSARARLKHAANGSYDAIKGQQFSQLPTQMFANAFTSARYRQTSQHALGEKGYIGQHKGQQYNEYPCRRHDLNCFKNQFIRID